MLCQDSLLASHTPRVFPLTVALSNNSDFATFVRLHLCGVSIPMYLLQAVADHHVHQEVIVGYPHAMLVE